MTETTTTIDTLMRKAPVIPVLVIDDVAHAIPIAQALVAGGLPVLEVTLRTACAIDAIRAMKTVPGAIVGAGTVLNPADLDKALAAGSEFIVSPGLTPTLGAAAGGQRRAVPARHRQMAADIMLGLDFGLTRFKFFPAEASGGIAALKAIAAPFGMVRFLPHRRHHPGQRAGLAGGAGGGVRRRQLDAAQGRAGCSRHRKRRARGGEAESLKLKNVGPLPHAPELA